MNRSKHLGLDARNCGVFAAGLGLLMSLSSSAEEGGSGHYMPGSMSSFMDGVPFEPSRILRINYLYYDGDLGADRALPIAGLTALDVQATSNALGLTGLWAPDWDLGDKWSFAMSATVPLVSMKVSADVFNGLATVARTDRDSGLGDLVLIPLMFNYHASRDFNVNLRLAAYAPTGDYKTGRLANTGKNFWTLEPTVALMYLGPQNGIEASLFFGADFNEKNDDTNYKSGDILHLDGTLAQHFPVGGGLAGVGVNAFWYRQVSGDSGSGATFGDFKSRANGVGPVFYYATTIGSTDVIAEIKWLHEFDNKNRTEGDSIWLKVILKL